MSFSKSAKTISIKNIMFAILYFIFSLDPIQNGKRKNFYEFYNIMNIKSAGLMTGLNDYIFCNVGFIGT